MSDSLFSVTSSNFHLRYVYFDFLPSLYTIFFSFIAYFFFLSLYFPFNSHSLPQTASINSLPNFVHSVTFVIYPSLLYLPTLMALLHPAYSSIQTRFISLHSLRFQLSAASPAFINLYKTLTAINTNFTRLYVILSHLCFLCHLHILIRHSKLLISSLVIPFQMCRSSYP